MKIDFDEIIKNLEEIAKAITLDNDKLKGLLETARLKIENNKELKEILDDVKLLIQLIKDWMKGNYKEVSNNSSIMIIIGLLYLVNPFDLIPDFVVGGFIDDLFVLVFVIKKISVELEAYKKWKETDVKHQYAEINIKLNGDSEEIGLIVDIDQEDKLI